MLTAERREAILRMVTDQGRVDAGDLSKRFEVSTDTIRRDLIELDDAGLLRRVRGGALPRSPVPHEFTERTEREGEAKDRIGRLAATLVEANATIAIDSGTTTLAMARWLPVTLRATVVTNSLPVTMALMGHPGLDVVMLGGRAMGASQSVVGGRAVRAIRELRFDMAFLGRAAWITLGV